MTCKHGLTIGPHKNQCYECWYAETLPKRGRPALAPENELSERTQAILEAIRAAVKVGQAPTVREMQAACQMSSTAVVQHHLRVLEREGYVNYGRRNTSRHIQLTDKGRGYPSDTELLTRCLPYLPDNALRRALEERLAV